MSTRADRERTRKSGSYHQGLYVVDVESGQTTQVLELNAETRLNPLEDLGGEWSKDGAAIIYILDVADGDIREFH